MSARGPLGLVLVVLLAATGWVAGCRQAPLTGIGESVWHPLPHAGADASVEPKAIAAASYAPANLPADFRTRFPLVGSRIPKSRGHLAGNTGVLVRANETARVALRTGARELPVGSTLVAEHVPQGSLFVMYKRAAPDDARDAGQDDASAMRDAQAPAHAATPWRYAVIEADGTVSLGENDANAASACIACHAEAPRGGVFSRAH